ncbi:MAG: type II secretion system F family protein [Phycisphaerales bacterium]
MPKFRAKLRTEHGGVTVEVIDASTRDEAIARIRKSGRTLLEVKGEHDAIDIEEIRLRRAAKGVKRDEVIAFSGQLAVMLETGVPLNEALDAFIRQSKSSGLRKVIEVVQEGVKSGASFSASLCAFPTVFPTLMASLVRASEASGTLAVMLSRVADYLGKERRVTKQIKGAMTYPLVMSGMAIGVTGFLMVWVLPRFARIYQSRNAALPKPTQVVLWISNFLQAHGITLLIAAAVAGVAGFVFVKTPRGRYAADWLRVHTPVFGKMYSRYYLTRSTRTLGTLLQAGVPLVEAIRIVRGVTNNLLWDRLWRDMNETLTEGGTLAEVVQDSDLINPAVAQMIAAGERSGRLPEVLGRIAESSEHDLDEAIKTGTQLIEPIMIIVMGGLIGGMAIALLLPIFTISSAVAN